MEPVGNTSPSDGLLVWVVIIVGSTVWVGIDSRSIRRKGLDNKPAWLWVLECLLVWIVFFPWYLVHRHRRLKKRPMTSSWPPPDLPPPPPSGTWPPPDPATAQE